MANAIAGNQLNRNRIGTRTAAIECFIEKKFLSTETALHGTTELLVPRQEKYCVTIHGTLARPSGPRMGSLAP